MSWKKNVFLCNWSQCPEKRTYFFHSCKRKPERERIVCAWKENEFSAEAVKTSTQLKKMFTQMKPNPLARESLNENVFFVPEKKTYFFAKAGKISPQSKKMFTQRKQNTAWKRTYFLCLKRKRIFLRKQAKVLPNWGEFSLKGNQAHLEITSGTWFASQVPKERTYCLIFQNNLKCGARNSVKSLWIEQGRYRKMQWRNLYFNILYSFSFVCLKLQTPLYKDICSGTRPTSWIHCIDKWNCIISWK